MKTVTRAAQLLASAAMLPVIMGAPSASAQTMEEAAAALGRGDYSTVLAGFRFYAEQGDARAQFNLGAMYANGEGVLRTTRRRFDGIGSPPSRATPARS